MRLKNLNLKQKRKGLTLLEVMLVIAFLSIAFLPMLQMFGRSFLISSESEATMKAITLSEKVIEEEKNLSYGNIVNVPKTAVSGFPGFSEQVDVAETSPNLKDIAVTIYYPVGGSELTLTLNTLVANY